MKEVKHKYQIEYEKTTGCFWKAEPAKYVKLLVEKLGTNISHLKILDLGAGEGKNSVFLASKGAEVVGIDVSKLALSRFHLQPNFEEAKHRIQIAEADIRKVDFQTDTFDIIIAYGVLHCLSSKSEVEEIINKIRNWIKPRGYFVCATFTNEIPPPVFQNYLEMESFLDRGQLQLFFRDWKIIDTEDDVISETHPTSNIEHYHSITRLIAQKL